jgi:hypothetical protein
VDILRNLFEGNLFKAGRLLLFAPIIAICVFTLFWQPEREILWNGSWIIKNCMNVRAQGNSSCIGDYELSVANMGEKTERVVIEWPLSLDRWSVDKKALNLSADRKRAHDPDYSCNWQAEHASCSIDNFAAGTLLIITLRCLLCEQVELESLDTHTPVLVSEARVYRSDPRATLLFRRVGLLISLF